MISLIIGASTQIFLFSSDSYIAISYKFILMDKRLTRTLRLLAVKDFCTGHRMDLVMAGQKGRAVTYLVSDEEQSSFGG